MSGLRKSLPELGFGGNQIQPSEIDRYEQYFIFAPSVDTAYIGTVTTAGSAAVVLKNALPDYPRNLAYSVTGVAGGMGGTFNLFGQDQFGGTVAERVTIGSANGGGTVQGTAIFAKVASGNFSANGLGGTALGTAAIGFGTAPGTAGTAGNYFGLPTKLGGTADVKSITWITTNTPTTLNGGTAIGTLVNTTTHSFCGTSGVAITDRYLVTFKPSFDASSLGTQAKL